MNVKACLAAAFLQLVAPVLAAAQETTCFDPARMGQLVKETGLAWEQRSRETWRVDLESRTRAHVRVAATCTRTVAIVFAILADAKQLKRSEELYLYLLQTASKYNHVKIAIDPDGDYLVRIDLRARTFDAQDLESAARLVRAVVDEMTPTLRDHLDR